MNNISTEISQRKELGILDQKQVDQDDQQFEKVLQSAERHKLRVQHLIDSDGGEDKQERTMIDARDLEIGAATGTFPFGTVHEGFLRKKHLVAIRVIDRDIDVTTLSIIKRGIRITWNLQDCDYILRTHGMVLSKDKKWMIVSATTAFGSLNDFFKKKRFEISKPIKIQLARNIAVGLDYLHTARVIHKGLRSHHIMLTDDFDPKITGFELCREVTTNSSMIDVDLMVKRWWSPERLQGKPSSKEPDVYAFGMLMYEISLAEELPENGIEEGFETGVVHKKYSKILHRCIHQDPKERPTMKQVLEWLTSLEAEYVNEY